MKRAYDVSVEVGERMWAKEYLVMATNADSAMKKAISKAVKDTGRITGWRVTHLHELQSEAIS